MKMYLSKAEAQQRYERIAKRDLAGLGATKAKLHRLLKSVDLVGWSTREESGRLDRRALTRYAAGSTAIFSRREMKEAEKAAVSVLIDCSASMTFDCGIDTRIDIANEIAIHLAKIFNGAGVEFAVSGFRSTSGSTDFDYESNATINRSGVYRFKQWNESLNSAAPKLGIINKCAVGGTPDYAGVYTALEELSRRPENKRVLFLITDSDAYKVSHMKHLQKIADTQKIKLIALGINANSGLNKSFRDSVNLHSTSNLTGAAFNHLLDKLRS